MTHAEYEANVERKRNFDAVETAGRLDAEQRERTGFALRANENATGKRALQAAAGIRIETDMEQSIAKVGQIASATAYFLVVS